VVLLFVIFRVVTKNYGHIKLSFSWSYLTRKLREAIPFGLSDLLLQLSSRVDIVLMGFFKRDGGRGLQRCLPGSFYSYVCSWFRCIGPFPDDVEAIYKFSFISSLGEDFAESALILRYFAWLLLLAFLKSFMEILLTSCDRQAEGTRSQWTAACVNVVGNVILIPSIGIKGAAIAVLAPETLVVILYAMQIRTFIGWPWVGSRLVISTVGTAIFYATFSLLPAMTITIVVPASIAIYAITLLCFKGVRENEIPMLMDLLVLRKP
jgi:O-antigen/teichoic acid export membrane protein